jgi:signal transduction histidine kinase
MKMYFLQVKIPALVFPQKVPHMFKVSRLENVVGRSYEGTGIGLSLIQELVQLHGGTINVKSKEKDLLL